MTPTTDFTMPNRPDGNEFEPDGGEERVSMNLVELHKRRTFLDKYGMDISKTKNQEVWDMYDRVMAISNEKIQILSRGQVLSNIERLLQFVPEGFEGQFFREDPGEIHAAQALGWVMLYDDRAKLESSTGTSDGRVRLGDQIVMIMPKETFIALKFARDKHIQDIKRARDPKRMAKEETARFAAPVNTEFTP